MKRFDRSKSAGTSKPGDSHLYGWLIGGIFAGGTLPRLILYLFATPRYDESYTHLHFATTSMWDALSLYETPNNHILYSVVARISQVAGESSILATRLPALIAGVLLIPVTIHFARLVTHSRRVAVTAGLLVAFHPQLIYYSTNGRGYTMIALFAVIWAILGYHIASEDAYGFHPWLALSIVTALGIWTIPVFVYALPGLVIWVILVRRSQGSVGRRFIGRATAAGLLALVLTATVFSPAISRMTLDGILSNPLLNPTSPRLGGVPGRELSSWFQRLPVYFSDIVGWITFALPLIVTVGLAMLTLVGVISRKSPLAIRVLVPTLIPPALILMAVQRLQPLARSWITMVPFLLVTVAVGAAALSRERRILVAPAVAAVAASLLFATVLAVRAGIDDESSFRSEYAADMEEVVQLMAERFPRGATLVVSSYAVPQTHYWLSRHPEVVIGGETRVVAIDHRLGLSLDDLADMRHVYAQGADGPARRVGVSKTNLTPIRELASTTVYWNGR